MLKQQTKLLLTLWTLAVAAAQTPLTLREASRRVDPALTPAHEGAKVAVQGTVASNPIRFGDYSQVPMVDESGAALTLEAPDFMFERVTPGDQLEVRGIIGHRGGLPVLRIEQLTTHSHAAVPVAPLRKITDLQAGLALGRTVVLEGRVMALGEDSGGDYLLLDGGKDGTYPVYLPKAASQVGAGLGRYEVSDRVRAIGHAAQAGSEPPYNSKYRMVVTDAGSVVLLDRDWVISPQLLLAGFLSLGTLIGWSVHRRQRRMRSRRAVRRIHGFCEELLTVSSVDDMRRKLRGAGTRALEVGAIELYRNERGGQLLRATLADPLPAPIEVKADGVDGINHHPVALCFRNRTPLHISDTRNSTLYWGSKEAETPRGVVLLPMFAREELIGVLEILHHYQPRYFSFEELTALQHMANQISMVLKLIEQQARKEQMMRSQRLAATGQIISGVAGELKGPLESILRFAHKLLDHGDSEGRSIVNESLRASAILNRYTQVVSCEEGEQSPVELNAILERVVEFARKDIAASEVCLDVSLSEQPLWIVGPAGQVEQVLRNLVQLSARSAADSPDRTLRIQSSIEMRRVQIAIRYGALLCDEYFPAGPASNQENDVLGFGVCRGILHSLGGDLRILRAGENSCTMEVDMPAAFPVQAVETALPAKSAGSSRTLTAIILEPDGAAQRRLVSYWTSRKHRAVPIQNHVEARELLNRLRIDVVFCALRIPGGSWVEFFDYVREQVPAFVLMADGFDSDVAGLFPEGDGFLLRKPMEAGEMDRLLEKVEMRVEAGAVA